MKGPVKAHPDCKLVATVREPLHYVNPTSKTQIDRLGNRLRKGKFGDDEVHQLDEYRRSFAEAYEEVVAVVRTSTKLEPTGRPAKSTTSIIEKLQRETIRLSQMQDVAGCRLVVQDILTQDKVVAELMAALPSAVVVDRRKQPSHGYRAVHIIATAYGKPVEIQVRTELQHLWAQLSEKLSDVVDSAIKYGSGEPKLRIIMSEGSKIIGESEEFEIKLAGLTPKEEETSQSQEQTVAMEEFFRAKKEVREQLERSIARLEGLSRKRTGG